MTSIENQVSDAVKNFQNGVKNQLKGKPVDLQVFVDKINTCQQTYLDTMKDIIFQIRSQGAPRIEILKNFVQHYLANVKYHSAALAGIPFGTIPEATYKEMFLSTILSNGREKEEIICPSSD